VVKKRIRMLVIKRAVRNPIIVFGAVKVDLQFISDEYL
jgi:hypothetical protein